MLPEYLNNSYKKFKAQAARDVMTEHFTFFNLWNTEDFKKIDRKMPN